MRHSVILTSYNRPTLIKRAIRSVREQTHQDFQLVIIDDGSDENTISSISQEIRDDVRCLLVHTRDPIPSDRKACANRLVDRINEGLEQATGEIIHYLADDDFYDRNRFRVFEELFKDPSVVVGYGRLYYINENGHLTGETRFPKDISDPWNALDHNQVAHRRSALDKVQIWDQGDFGDFAPDGYFFRKLRNYWDFHGIDRIVAYKRYHPLNMQNTKWDTGACRE